MQPLPPLKFQKPQKYQKKKMQNKILCAHLTVYETVL